jgi:signal transduction histidine kinase/DNA-binding NarL/FixJ family response regulator
MRRGDGSVSGFSDDDRHSAGRPTIRTQTDSVSHTRGVGSQREPEAARAAIQATYDRADRWMTIILSGHFAIGLGIAPFHDTWIEAALVGGLAAGLYVLCRVLLPGTLLTRCMAGVSLQLFVGLHIHQMHGLAETQFFVFTALTAMIVYQDGRALWPGTALAVLGHALLLGLHAWDVPIAKTFFEGRDVGAISLSFHFSIVLLHAVLCRLFATTLRRRTIEDAIVRQEIADARESAEHASAAKSRFLATMSHEFRSPLQGIHGMSELLLGSSLPSEHHEQVAVIHDASDALTALVDDVLDLSKIEAGRLQLDLQPFDLAELVDNTVASLRPGARSSHIEIDYSFAAALREKANVVGDRLRIRQILVNLLGNAIKFGSQGDIVEVRAHFDGHDRWSISIRDQGPGIAPEARSRVFEEYGQADGARTTSRFGGTGLGLPISQQLARMMDGHIELESELGKGATFTVELRLPTAPREDVVQRTSGRMRHFPGLRALVADDDAVCRRVVEMMLRQARCDVTAVDNGDAAVELARQEPFDLILLDLSMGPTGGLLAARRMRQDEKAGGLARAPIYAVTGNVLREELDDCLDAGMDGRLLKPVRLRALDDLLGEVAGDRSRDGPRAESPTPQAEVRSTTRERVGNDRATPEPQR